MFQPTRENPAFLRGLIVSGMEINVIADYLECRIQNRRKVQRWKAKFYAEPYRFLIDFQYFNRGEKLLTLQQTEYIRLISEEDPFMPATKIKKALQLTFHLETVRSVMKENQDIHCFSPAIKNKLNNLDKQRRLSLRPLYTR